ncbi:MULTISPECIES: DUF6541 family protein [unclassified Microbacterium]|uniref:DUF6541 family protein n=1 Tax=unclassified Microbacterium TaxID=2609290 RepID=UPI0012FA2AA1|nr:DUF6541 family protein [Microbacterium sp. MAH-37]MVQ41831.1 hypothetical protein [Microbacterium sp. MAH-37]
MLELVLCSFAAVAVLAVVGIPLGLAMGLRGLRLWAASAPFALTIVGVSAVLASWLTVTWSILPVLAVAALVGLAILLLRRRLLAPATRSWGRGGWWVVGALTAAAIVMAVRVMTVLGAADALSQTFDNIFHLNGIRYILTTGSASSLTLGGMTSGDGSLPFYPAVWHAWVSLVVQLTGTSIPLAVNAVVLATCAIIWPAGLVLLVRTLLGSSPVVAAVGAAISTAVPAFPLLLMQYGVLYPYQLGLALVPVGITAVARLCGITADRDEGDALTWVLVLVGVIPGVSLAHPGAFVALLALTTPFVALFVIRMWRTKTGLRARTALVAGCVGYLVAGVLALKILRPPLEARLWPPQLGFREALTQVMTVSMWYGVPAVLLAVALAAGIVWALVDRDSVSWALLGMFAVGAVLFVAVAALPVGDLRDALTGSWYNNFPRLAAILAIAMMPLAVYGVWRTLLAVGRLPMSRRVVARAPRMAGALAIVAVVGLFGVLVAGPQMDQAVSSAAGTYALTERSRLLSTDEARLLSRLDEHVPAGVTVAGSAWTGASLASAIADRPVLQPHTLMHIDEDTALVDDSLDEAVPGSPVCAAVHRLGVGYVLDFGDREVHGEHHPMPGFDHLAESDSVRLVDQEGAARLYEVIGCR